MRRRLAALTAWLFSGPWQCAGFVVALLVLSLVAHIFFLAAQWEALESERNKEPMLKQAYRDKYREAAALPLWREREAALPPALQASRPSMPMQQFAALAQRHGLRVESLDADQPTTTIEPFAVRSARVRLSGGFQQFAAFAEALATGDQPLAMRQQIWTADPHTPVLTLQAGVDAIRLLDEQERAMLAKARAKAKAPKE